MPKPSVYAQLNAAQVKAGPFTPPSPRHWNPGLIRYKGRLWIAVRYHLGREHASRCATCMIPLDKTTMQPTALFQHLNLPATVGDEHFEDARLFLFQGKPHISYTQMTGYEPGKNYSCVMKYARLKLLGNRWLIEETFQPDFGRNNGFSKEKNWQFFEYNDQLYCVYQDSPERKIIRLDGGKVVQEISSPTVKWPWGEIRGGAPPIPYSDGQMLAIFHSSLPTEEAPHYVRYYAGAYTFEAKPPFRITSISTRPIAGGSEADGHGYDPRYAEGWKPFVVFPCGCVQDGEDYLISMGVNDWQCAVGRVTVDQLHLGSTDDKDRPLRCFTTSNGTLEVRTISPDGTPTWITWHVPVTDKRGAMAPWGYYATRDGREAEALADAPRVTEITQGEYERAVNKAV